MENKRGNAKEVPGMGSYDPQIISKNKKNCVFSKTCKENKLKNELPPYYLKHSDIGKP